MDEQARRPPEEVLRIAIDRESEALDFYAWTAREARDLELREFLLELADEDRKRLERLKVRLEEAEIQHWLEEAVTC